LTPCTGPCASSAPSRRLCAAALLLALAACDTPARAPKSSADAPAEPRIAAAQPASAGEDRSASWDFRLPGHGDRPELVVTLDGELSRDTAAVTVRRLMIRDSAADAPFQQFDGLAASPPLEALQTGRAFEALDMNFDGYQDFRLLEVAPAGPNVLWANWLYDPASRSFSRAARLDALTAPQFEPESRRITSTERSGAARTVTETFDFSHGRLELVRRSVKEYSAPGRYRLTVSEPVEGQMRVTEERIVEESPSGQGDG